jgi:hypothetical protein
VLHVAIPQVDDAGRQWGESLASTLEGIGTALFAASESLSGIMAK